MHYYLVNKPYGMLSQFTREAAAHLTLADLCDFPPSVYPVGRLDRDSEGLLILTDDKRLNHRLLNPKFAHSRNYWVLVEGQTDYASRSALSGGPQIRVGKKAFSPRPLIVEIIAPALPPRDPPVRIRKTIVDQWLSLTLTEGKNRQVRRMCAAVGHPVLRLLRQEIEGVSLQDLNGEAVAQVDGGWLRSRLKI